MTTVSTLVSHELDGKEPFDSDNPVPKHRFRNNRLDNWLCQDRQDEVQAAVSCNWNVELSVIQSCRIFP